MPFNIRNKFTRDDPGRIGRALTKVIGKKKTTPPAVASSSSHPLAGASEAVGTRQSKSPSLGRRSAVIPASLHSSAISSRSINTASLEGTFDETCRLLTPTESHQSAVGDDSSAASSRTRSSAAFPFPSGSLVGRASPAQTGRFDTRSPGLSLVLDAGGGTESPPGSHGTRRSHEGRRTPPEGHFHEKTVDRLMVDDLLSPEDHAAYVGELNARIAMARPGGESSLQAGLAMAEDDPRKQTISDHIEILFILGRLSKSGLIDQGKFDASLTLANEWLSSTLQGADGGLFGHMLNSADTAHLVHLGDVGKRMDAREKHEATLDELTQRGLVPATDAERFKGVLAAWVKASPYLGHVVETQSQHDEMLDQDELAASLERAGQTLEHLHNLERLETEGILDPQANELASRVKAGLTCEAIEQGPSDHFTILLESCSRLADAGRICRLAVEVSEGRDCDDAKASLGQMGRALPGLVDSVSDLDGYVAMRTRLADGLRNVSLALDSALQHAPLETEGPACKDLRKMTQCLDDYIDGVDVLAQTAWISRPHWREVSKNLDDFLSNMTSGATERDDHADVLKRIEGYRLALS